MSSDCTRCPPLAAEVTRLTGVVAAQAHRIDWLTFKLGQLRAAVTACTALLAAESEHTTMPRHQLLGNVYERLRAALYELERRSP